MSELQQENQSGDAPQDDRQHWPSPGQKVKKLREELGYSREKVSEALYITVHYVTALENDDFHKLPGNTFTKGYFKAYAEFLGADVDDILDCYLNYITAGENQEKQESTAREKKKNKRKNLVWFISAVIALALIVGVVLWLPRNANAAGLKYEKYEKIENTESPFPQTKEAGRQLNHFSLSKS